MNKEEISKAIEECEEKLKNLRDELNKPEYGGKRWKPKKDEEYYCICTNGVVDVLHFDSEYDSGAYACGNCGYRFSVLSKFKTREEAEFEAERRKVIAELSDYAEGDEAVWDRKTAHWHIYYSFVKKEIAYDCHVSYKIHQLYFPSKEAAKAAVEAVGEERVKKYYLGVK